MLRFEHSKKLLNYGTFFTHERLLEDAKLYFDRAIDLHIRIGRIKANSKNSALQIKTLADELRQYVQIAFNNFKFLISHNVDYLKLFTAMPAQTLDDFLRIYFTQENKSTGEPIMMPTGGKGEIHRVVPTC